MKKKINKRFEDMIKLSVKPFPEDQKKSEKKQDDDYTDKKTHPHNSVDASG